MENNYPSSRSADFQGFFFFFFFNSKQEVVGGLTVSVSLSASHQIVELKLYAPGTYTCKADVYASGHCVVCSSTLLVY